MKLKVLVNGNECEFESDKLNTHEAISDVRERIKKEFKKQKQKCELWFIDIIEK